MNFAVTWDYRCPFARIGHNHILTGLADGANWDVSFKAFSLDQTHVHEGHAPVWDEPDRYPGLIANLAGIAVRDGEPDKFLAAHGALFEARHEQALDVRDPTIVAKVLDSVGVDGAGVLAAIEAGWPLERLRDEHTEAVDRYQVFGVPTFIAAGQSVFVRLMRGPASGEDARATIDRIIEMITGWPELNEFKHTSLAN